MRGRTITAAVAAAAMIGVAGCGAGGGVEGGGDGGNNGGGETKESLSVGFTAPPATLDFSADSGAAIPQALLVNVYEGLVKVNPKGEVIPALAKDWEVKKGGKVYVFDLVEGATFSNGKRFTAEDAVFSINRVKDKWKMTIANQMDVVKKAEAVNEHKLRVTLKHPSHMWLKRMSTRIGAMFDKGSVDNLATNPVGTGPYDVSDWKPGNALTLKLRDDYWGKAPDVEEFVLRYFDNPSAMNSAMQAGNIDVISNVQTPESLSQFENDKFEVIEGTTNGEVVLAMNNQRKPFDDKRVRKAVRHAIDHEALIESAWAGHGAPIGSMVPPTDPWYEDLTGMYPHDKAKARKLLKKAGHKPGEVTVQFRIPTIPYAENAAQVVRSQLKKVGINAKIEPVEFPDPWLNQVFTNANYDMSIISHVEPWDLVTWSDPKYYWGYDSTKFQTLIKKADRAPTEKQFLNTMQKAARKLSEDAAADFLFVLPNLMVTTKQVTGLPENVVSEAFDLTTIEKK